MNSACYDQDILRVKISCLASLHALACNSKIPGRSPCSQSKIYMLVSMGLSHEEKSIQDIGVNVRIQIPYLVCSMLRATAPWVKYTISKVIRQ